LYFTFISPLSAQWLDAYIPDFKVNDDNLNSYQTNSQIGVDSAGNFVIVWRDVRNNPGNTNWPQVYCQIYDRDGFSIGNNFRVGQDTASRPEITVLKNGRFVVVWTRFLFVNSIQFYEIYFQRFLSNGQQVGSPVNVLDTALSVSDNLFAGLNISSDSTGNFIICWAKKPDINSYITLYYQRFDNSGNKIDTIQTVNEVISHAEFPSVACNKDGSFVIAWQDNRANITEGKYDVYIQRYNSNGVKQGNNVKVNDDAIALLFRGGAKVSTNGYGQTVVAWLDPRACGFGEIFYQVYAPNGNTLGVNRKANSSPCGDNVNSAVVSMRNDKFFYIAWSEWFYSGREQFYGRRFDSIGNAIGNSYMIPASSLVPATQRSNSVFLLKDRVYSTWSHNLNSGVNVDIYCNVRGFQNPDTVIGIVNQSGIAGEFKLFPAYPNPFNPSTVIKFDLPQNTFVSVKVFNVLGELIAVILNNEFKNAGSYSINFDGSFHSSGVYFCSIQAGNFSSVKKMVLIQ